MRAPPRWHSQNACQSKTKSDNDSVGSSPEIPYVDIAKNTVKMVNSISIFKNKSNILYGKIGRDRYDLW